MSKTYCLGGRHMSNTNNIVEYEKVNPRTKKNSLKLLKELVVSVDEVNHIVLQCK